MRDAPPAIMRTLSIVVVLAACLGDSRELVETTPDAAEPAAPALCEFVAVQEGPCSLACEPEALVEQFVPRGMCAMFDCAKRDGSIGRLGGCRPE
jgi:hypothetical protein